MPTTVPDVRTVATALLHDALRAAVGGSIFSRGRSYAERGCVRSRRAFADSLRSDPLREDEVEFRGCVRGSHPSPYTCTVIFNAERGEWKGLRCTCPYVVNCKHAVALGLSAVDVLVGYGDRVSRGRWARDAFLVYGNADALASAYRGDEEHALRAIVDEIDAEDEEEEENEINGQSSVMSRIRGPQWSMPQTRRSSRTLRVPDPVALTECTVVLFPGSSYGGALHASMAYRGNSITPESALRRAKDPTDAQRTFLAFLQKFASWEPIDYRAFFFALRDAAMPIAWQRSDYLLRIDAQPPKFRIALHRRSMRHPETKERIVDVFGALRDIGSSSAGIVIPTAKGILTILDGAIAYRALPKAVMTFISRNIRDRYQSFGRYGTDGVVPLSDSELVHINMLLQLLRTYCDLETNLPMQCAVTRHDRATPCIVIAYDREKETVDVRIAVDYGCARVDVGRTVWRYRSYGKEHVEHILLGASRYVVQWNGDAIEYARIRKTIEIETFRRVVDRSLDFGLTKQLSANIDGSKAIFRFIRLHIPRLQELGWPIVFPHDRLEVISGAFSAHFDIAANAKQDWLAFDVETFRGTEQVTLAQLQSYEKDRDGNVYVPLEDGRWWRVENVAEFERFIALLESFQAREDGKQFEGRLWSAPELDAMAKQSTYYHAKMDESFATFMSEAKSGKPVTPVALPDAVHRTLRGYQCGGVDWMHFLRQYRFGGVLADDMGTGKTLQALTVVHRNREMGTPSLVVCPKSLLRNWEQEAARFFPDLRTCVLDGQPAERRAMLERIGDYDLAITSYATLQRDAEVFQEAKRRWNYCILDEAQAIKNPRTKNAHTVKGVDAAYRLALTGTPLENSVSEVWSIFDFLMPGFLGKYDRFVEHFERPIMERGDDRALAALREKTRCFMLRRTKSEVLKELPPKVEQRVTCDLTDTQRILYEEIRMRAKKDIADAVAKRGFAKSHIHIFAALTKLRQACDHPALLVKDVERYRNESGKLDGFRELVSEVAHAKRKVLVFSQFTQMLDLLKLELQEMRIPYVELTGKTENRQELVHRFNTDPTLTVFLMSLKAGGVGLNLASADTVILYDPWWNPAVERQAIDRTHRIGQTHSVNVYRLITKGTIEEKMLKLQERKQQLFDSLVASSGNLFQKLTWEDVQELFE